MNSIEWLGDRVRFIDQTQLPLKESYIETDDYHDIADAIRTLKIRGAPLIGVAAAYGVSLAGLKFSGRSISEFRSVLEEAINHLAATRPTAVNLFWSLDRIRNILKVDSTIPTFQKRLVDEAIAIHREDEAMCRKIAEHGANLLTQQSTIITHCNAGALATGGIGTALGVIKLAVQQNKTVRVFVDETRPLLQGARLTMWELMKSGIDATLITDSMAAFTIQREQVNLVIVGADRIAANGDTANKIGTYNLAIAAQYHRVPFYVAAPTSTIDPTLKNGNEIPIEERSPEEVTEGFGTRVAPPGVKVCSPAFDITPGSLITAIITDRGIHYPPYDFSVVRNT